MPALDRTSLLTQIAPPLDAKLAEQLVDEFISLEQRYVLRDWSPATLDAGQFTEAAARILYHRDSGTLALRKPVGDCLRYVEDVSGKLTHNYPDRQSALHTCRVLRAVYKFRSARGAVHIDPVYTANQLDSKMVLENSRWVLSEILRIFWSGSRADVASVIRTIVTFDFPVVGEFSGTRLVQRTDLTAEEEILILLHHAGIEGLSRRQLGQYVPRHASNVTKALRRLTRTRQVHVPRAGNVLLTDLGVRRVLEQLAEKLQSSSL